jgi:hypothetical protein
VEQSARVAQVHGCDCWAWLLGFVTPKASTCAQPWMLLRLGAPTERIIVNQMSPMSSATAIVWRRGLPSPHAASTMMAILQRMILTWSLPCVAAGAATRAERLALDGAAEARPRWRHAVIPGVLKRNAEQEHSLCPPSWGRYKPPSHRGGGEHVARQRVEVAVPD